MKSAAGSDEALAVFHPLVAQWFRERLGTPTEVQSGSWPRIAAGGHVLITAPTGSGKTLTAFLWALNQLLTGAWSGGRVRVLYVSPLRALNNDIQRNLLGPLGELEQVFADAGQTAPPVRVLTRSGDTPPGERQRMARHPPEVLITTPESLNILLTSQGGRALLGDLASVVLDEIDAVASSKRGTHLATAVERLTLLSGELQRIALSATVKPLERVARFVGGYRHQPRAAGAEPGYEARQVSIVEATTPKSYDLRVLHPAPPADKPSSVTPPPGPVGGSVWEPLVEDLRARIKKRRSTLVFANSRRVTEKLTRLLNEDQAHDLAYSHHGSLAREIRAVVEERLKEGRLAAIVATNSLELGIDIGSLDEVVLVQTPPTVASAVQRIGRAGHGVGEVSHGRIYPLFERDYLSAAVVARGVLDQDIEEVRPITGALDVLAQIVLSMVATESWGIDDLFDFIRTSYPYRELTRRQFDLVLEMLAGRYADSRIRELKPRISIDRVAGTVVGRRGAARLVYLSGGTIPDRGYYHLRLEGSMAKLGELDEEFVWERSVGDTFTLGAQSWRIRSITHNDVLVSPAHRSSAMAPFWRAEERDRSFHLSAKMGGFLEQAEAYLAAPGGGEKLARHLEEHHCLDQAAAAELVGLLERQRSATGCPLPHRHHLVLEEAAGTTSPEQRQQVILHTFWGGEVNRPLALALAVAGEEELGFPVTIEHDNDSLMISLPQGVDARRLLELVRPERLEQLLRLRLERTGFFGARFRESAGRALLLPRASFRRRTPLWLNRQRSKKLLERVSSYEDFPVVVETWRTCLQDSFDLDSLKRLLDELEGGEIGVSVTATASPSPFADQVVWKQTNRLMYEDDTPAGAGGSQLSQDLLQELVFSSQLRPRIPAHLVDGFERKLQRVHPGYAPRGARELVDWTIERIVLPEDEWRELLATIERDGESEGQDIESVLGEVADRVVRLRLPASGPRLVCAVETLPRLRRALGLDPSEIDLASLTAEDAPPAAALAALEQLEAEAETQGDGEETDPLAELLGEWLRYFGPVSREFLATTFGLGEDGLRDALETLVATQRVVIDRFRETDEDQGELEICDSENLESLLRLLRTAARPAFEALPIESLPLFLAEHQGLNRAQGEPEALRTALERLFGYPAPVSLWETDLLPARLDPYYTSWLDGLMQESDLVWIGCGQQKLSFGLDTDLVLFAVDEAAAAGESDADDNFERAFPDPGGRVGFDGLARHTEWDAAELSRRLWQWAWEGKISNTTFLAVRKGISGRFEAQEIARDAAETHRATGAASSRRRFSRRGRLERWRSSRPLAGDWFRLPDSTAEGEVPLDALDREELNKERVRLLLDRYGVLFRELLERELPALKWSRLFRSLRLMELSGEILAGHFFAGIPGLQFVSPHALRALRQGLAQDTIFWVNALDPASPSGLGLEAIRGDYPARHPSTHLVFHGPRLVVTSRRHGGELEIRVGPDHPSLGEYLGFLKVLLTRQFEPRRSLTVETINGEPAVGSPYAEILTRGFQTTREQKAIRLRRRY
ncbi:MAG: DEAD/DEAH box helicase [Thermoanaerobaculia bacterium]